MLLPFSQNSFQTKDFQFHRFSGKKGLSIPLCLPRNAAQQFFLVISGMD
jgi:hypothetical protein